MKYVVTAEQMRKAEGAAGVAAVELMENAGLTCSNEIKRVGKGKRILVLCGPGNNGGDGIVLAHHLRKDGGDVSCLFVKGLPASGCAQMVHSKYKHSSDVAQTDQNREQVMQLIEECDILVDCVFGTGFHGHLPDQGLFETVNHSKALKIAVDVPSGMNSDTGQTAPHGLVADITLSLGAVKQGTLYNPDVCGSNILLDIGIKEFAQYQALLTDNEVWDLMPPRIKNSHKGTYGRVLNFAGSEQYIGAALLSCLGAINMGTGLVALCAPDKVISSIACAVPEAIFLARGNTEAVASYMTRATAVAVGCGLGNTTHTKALVEHVLAAAPCPVVLDADGINAVAYSPGLLSKRAQPVIITPHPGEFSRLTGISADQLAKNRIEMAKNAARELNVVVLLKGVNTVVAAPDGRAAVNTTGNAGLAKAGTGDVLTGMVASLCSQNVEPYKAAVLGAYLHGQAADHLAQNTQLYGINASAIANALPFLKKL